MKVHPRRAVLPAFLLSIAGVATSALANDPSSIGACAVGDDCVVTSAAGCAALGGDHLGLATPCFASSSIQEPPVLAADAKTDPVHLFSGEVVQSIVDLRIKGRGPDFEWKRTYRSRLEPVSGMGVGWDYSYNMRIYQLDLRPSEVIGVVFTDKTTMLWLSVSDPAGPTQLVRYCTLRSTSPGDFLGNAAAFVETDSVDTMTSDPAIPSPGQTFFYLVSAKNTHGAGPLGVESDGLPRVGKPCGAAGPDLVLLDGTGRRIVYDAQVDGTWSARSYFQVFSSNPNGTYTLTYPDTSHTEFHALDAGPLAGRITSLVDRNGNALQFQYDPQGRLMAVIDTLNRAITIAYNPTGFIDSVTDFTGRQLRYEYYDGIEPGGGLGDLKAAVSPAVFGTPNGNDYPLGKRMTYTYSTGFPDDRLNHNLLTATDGKGQTYLVNDYYTILNPADLNFDRIARQTWGSPDDPIDFVYVQTKAAVENGHGVLTTYVNDRMGNVGEYIFDGGNRLVVAREYTGRADPSLPTNLETGLNPPINPLRPSDPPFFESRNQWNPDSLLVSAVYPNLNQDSYTYDSANPSRRSQGNLLQHCEIAGPLGGPPSQICTSNEFDPAINFGTNRPTRQIDALGRSTTHTYDARGNRLSTTDRIAATVDDYEYNAFGQLTAHVHPNNGSGVRRRDQVTYQTSGPSFGYLRTVVLDALNVAATWTYEEDAVGNVTREIDPRGHDTLFVHNQLDQKVRSTSREVTSGTGIRYVTDFFYDTNDNRVREDVENRDESGLLQPNAHFSMIYDRGILDEITQVCSEAGSATLSPGVLSCGAIPPPQAGEFVSTQYGYDANRNESQVRYGAAIDGSQPANTLTTSYDERNLPYLSVRAQGDPSQSTTQLDYDGNGNLRFRREGMETTPRITEYRYDGYDRRTEIIDPMGNIADASFDANGNLAHHRVDGELNDASSGSAGNVRLYEETFFHDAMDRLLRVETQFFDPATQSPLQGGQFLGKIVSAATYTPNSTVGSVTDDRLNVRQTTYDTMNRQSTVTDAKGNRVTYGYDANSNVVTITELEESELGAPDRTYVTTRRYDNLDRLIQVEDNVGNQTSYFRDSRGNVTRSTDPLGRETRRKCDGLSRLTEIVRDMNGNGADAGDLLDIVKLQTWDASSRRTGETDDNGRTTSYQYDALDRIVQTGSADGTAEIATYDVHDNVTSMTDGNGSFLNDSFDLLDRRIARSILPGPSVANDITFELYRYDGANRLVRAENNASILTFGYNSLSDTTSETLYGQTITATFDGRGNRTSVTFPGGRTVTATYDSLNRRKTLSDAQGNLATYFYLGPSRVERRDFRNGTRVDYTYDGILPNPANDFGVKRVVRTRYTRIAGGTVLDDRTYTWDRAANKVRRADVRVGGPRLTHDFAYDAADRITNVTVTDPTLVVVRNTGYTLDGAGNRTFVTGSIDPGPYAQDAFGPPQDAQVNQYTSTPFDAREYDHNGNLIRITPNLGPARTLRYNYRNDMVEYFDGSTGQRHTYAYDAIGRRIAKVLDTDGAHTETRYFRQGGHVVEAQSPPGTTIATYVWGQSTDEILSMRRGNADFFYHTDDLGSVMALTNSAGSIVERYDYQDFGVPEFRDTTGNVILSIPESAFGNPFLFQGRRYDTETSWYCHRTRYRDPRAGVWTARDAIGPWGDPSSLGKATAFVGNNPASSVDPLGLEKKAEPEESLDPLDEKFKKVADAKAAQKEVEDGYDKWNKRGNKNAEKDPPIEKDWQDKLKKAKDAVAEVEKHFEDELNKAIDEEEAKQADELNKKFDELRKLLEQEIVGDDTKALDETISEPAVSGAAKKEEEVEPETKKKTVKVVSKSKAADREKIKKGIKGDGKDAERVRKGVKSHYDAEKKKVEGAIEHLGDSTHKKYRDAGAPVITPSGDDQAPPEDKKKSK